MNKEQCSETSAHKFKRRGITQRNQYNCLMFILVFIHKDSVLIFYLVLSIGVQLKADSVHRIYVYSLYYCMLKQVLESTSHKSQNV
jgi:hypothetical protein